MSRPKRNLGALERQQRWTNKKLYPWAMVSMALSVFQNIFSLDLLGDGLEYHIWITWVPLIIGLATLAAVRWKYLLLRSADMEGFGWKVLLWAFMFVQGLLFSYTTFGLVARTAADILNRVEVQNGAMRMERFPMKRAFMRGRRPHLEFVRNSQTEVIQTRYVKELDGQEWDPPYDIVLRTVPGILGTTIQLDYSWVRVERSAPTTEGSTN